MAEARRIVDHFLLDKRQELDTFLNKADHHSDPYGISDFERNKFLRARGSVPLDPGNQVNGAILKTSDVMGELEESLAGALSLYCALSHWSRLKEQRSGSICDLLGVTRLFGREKDQLSPSRRGDTVLILCRSRIMLLTAFEQGRLLPFASIWKALQTFLGEIDQHQPTALPVLTALPKGLAVSGFEEARAYGGETLEAIEDAVCVLSLGSCLTDADGKADLVKGLTGNGLDRWFGKTNVVIDEKGYLGFYFDHAVADGQLIMAFADGLQEQISALMASEAADPSEAPAPTEVVARFPDALEDRWGGALSAYRREIGRFSASRLDFKRAAQDSKSLATALPLACQAACYRLTGRLQKPYVPVARSHESERGLEFVHASAPGTAALIQALSNPGDDDLAALKRTLAWWRRAFLVAMLGPGGERFMHYLYDFAEELGLHRHPFFEAAGYPERLAYPPLCLSIVSGQEAVSAPVFPPARGGWSVGAITHEAGVNISVAGWDGVPAQAAAEIGRAMEEILALLKTEPSRDSPSRSNADRSRMATARSGRPGAQPFA